MSVLTKVFVVFHVVVSLLLAAGLIVFVNRTDVYGKLIETKTIEANTLSGQLQAKKADADAARGDAEKYRKLYDDGQASLVAAKAGPQKEIDDLRSRLAKADTDARIVSVAAGNTTSALTSALQQRKAVDDVLASTRADNDKLMKSNSELNLALSDTQTKLDVASRSEKDIREQFAEAQAEITRQGGLLKDAGGDKGKVGGLGIGAPKINAIVRRVDNVNGIPHAVISVGTDSDVKVGMQFSVIDRVKGQFLGFLTIDGVDAKEATGKLDGPHVPDIAQGAEVRTQL